MLETHRHEAVVELRLARPPVNALDSQLVKQLRTAIESAPALGARGIVLSGRAGMFSAGLDVPALLQLKRPELIAFFRDFFALCNVDRSVADSDRRGDHRTQPGRRRGARHLLRLPRDGAQRRCGETVPHRLNEVQVGLTVPTVIQLGLQRLVGAVSRGTPARRRRDAASPNRRCRSDWSMKW